MEKYYPTFLLVFFVVAVPAALYLILKPMLTQKKQCKGVVNYDVLMRKFVFRIDLAKDVFLNAITIRNTNDFLTYSIDKDLSVITFQKHNAQIPYRMIVEDFHDYVILKVEQIPVVADRSNIPYYINSFWMRKVNAVPIDYQTFYLR